MAPDGAILLCRGGSRLTNPDRAGRRTCAAARRANNRVSRCYRRAAVTVPSRATLRTWPLSSCARADWRAVLVDFRGLKLRRHRRRPIDRGDRGCGSCRLWRRGGDFQRFGGLAFGRARMSGGRGFSAVTLPEGFAKNKAAPDTMPPTRSAAETRYVNIAANRPMRPNSPAGRNVPPLPGRIKFQIIEKATGTV